MERQFKMEPVQAAMQELPDEQREVLILKFIAEFSTAQIAQRMDKSPGAVRALQLRALQALSKKFNEEDLR